MNGFLERLVLDRVLLAGVEIVVWLVAPLLIVLLLAGLGAWTVRHGQGLLALASAAVAGAVLLIGAVAAVNLLVPVPRWTPLAVAGLGTVGLAGSARRLSLTRHTFVLTAGVTAATVGAYRIGYSPLTYDAFLYHGVIVEWLGRAAVPQGFGLLHSRFAFDPGLMLISPAVRGPGDDWTHLVLVELAVVALAVLVLVALLRAALATRRRGSGRDVPLAALLLGLLATSALFLVLRQRGPGTDLAVGVTLVAAAGAAAALARRRAPDPGGFALLGMLAALAILQKASAAAVLLLLLAPLVARRAEVDGDDEDLAVADADTTSWRAVVPSLAVALAAGVAHTVRTFIMSGCLAYPVAATCIEAPWALGARTASDESATVRSWARSRSGAHPELLDLSWVGGWFGGYVRDEAFVVLAVGLLVGLITAVRRTARTGPLEAPRRDGLLWAYVAASALIWAASAPAPRFGIHLHLVLAALLAAPAIEMALRRPDAATASGGWRPVPARRAVPATLAIAVLILGGGLILEGRQLPVSGTVEHAMRELRMPLTVDGDPSASAEGWAYVVPVGSDQCGDAFPCAPGPRDGLAVRDTGRRLVFTRGVG